MVLPLTRSSVCCLRVFSKIACGALSTQSPSAETTATIANASMILRSIEDLLLSRSFEMRFPLWDPVACQPPDYGVMSVSRLLVNNNDRLRCISLGARQREDRVAAAAALTAAAGGTTIVYAQNVNAIKRRKAMKSIGKARGP